MTIDDAVATLNKFKWRGRDDWRLDPRRPLTILSTIDQQRNVVEGDQLWFQDATAIASWLELREACGPFFKEARFIVDCGLETSSHVGKVGVKHWRRLAELAGEKE